jgi:dGTPase
LPDTDRRFCRHPLVFLVEAADDICYQIMDLEDAHKLKLIGTDETKTLMLNYFSGERLAHIRETLLLVDDINEQIAYLRSCVIGRLIKACTQVFVDHEQEILDGHFNQPLIKLVDEESRSAFERIAEISLVRIYRSSDVLDIELAGYKIITTLLHEVIQAVNNPDRAYSKVLLARIPQQYEVASDSVYARIQAVLDYISGMTDVYALDLYQKMNGTSLPAL